MIDHIITNERILKRNVSNFLKNYLIAVVNLFDTFFNRSALFRSLAVEGIFNIFINHGQGLLFLANLQVGNNQIPENFTSISTPLTRGDFDPTQPEFTIFFYKMLTKSGKLVIQKLILNKIQAWSDKYGQVYSQLTVVKNFLKNSGLSFMEYSGDDYFDELGRFRLFLSARNDSNPSFSSVIPSPLSETKKQISKRHDNLINYARQARTFVKQNKLRLSKTDLIKLEDILKNLTKFLNIDSKEVTDIRSVKVFKNLLDLKFRVVERIKKDRIAATTTLSLTKEARIDKIMSSTIDKKISEKKHKSSDSESIHSSDFESDQELDMELFIFNKATELRDKAKQKVIEEQKRLKDEQEQRRLFEIEELKRFEEEAKERDLKIIKKQANTRKSKKSLLPKTLNNPEYDYLSKLFDEEVEQIKNSERRVLSIAKEMDLSNSWHRNESNDWGDHGYTERKQKIKSSKSSIDKPKSSNFTLSTDMSVAVVDIPVTPNIPILHTCRARLSNGKLCQRQDRFKCPFHGKIINRDEDGFPISSTDLNEVVESLFGESQSTAKSKNSQNKRKVATVKDDSESAVRKRLIKKFKKCK